MKRTDFVIDKTDSGKFIVRKIKNNKRLLSTIFINGKEGHKLSRKHSSFFVTEEWAEKHIEQFINERNKNERNTL